jgi:hypothetical protein
MSLDVSVYTRIELLQRGDNDEDFEEAHEAEMGEAIVFLWPNDDFPDHAEGVESGYYRVRRPTTAVDLNLRYSYYNFWRGHLSRLCTGMPLEELFNQSPELPAFAALLYFGDNEGIIGRGRCRTLARELAEWEPRAIAYSEKMAETEEEGVGETWLQVYRSWLRAAQAATPDGVIQFH